MRWPVAKSRIGDANVQTPRTGAEKWVEFPPTFPQFHRSLNERDFNLLTDITMPSIDIKPAGSCAYDMIALGEIMLRLDPGEGRVRTAREFKVWEGGGEYNVARGL